MHEKSLAPRIIGYAASLVLTLTAFLVIGHPELFALEIRTAILVILALGVVQAVVQSLCFLHILSEKGPRWNLIIFVSTISMILVIIVFSIWIMGHLDYNMMPSMH
jgi:cytochrome o ubiquinol oxidase subunit IV